MDYDFKKIEADHKKLSMAFKKICEDQQVSNMTMWAFIVSIASSMIMMQETYGTSDAFDIFIQNIKCACDDIRQNPMFTMLKLSNDSDQKKNLEGLLEKMMTQNKQD